MPHIAAFAQPAGSRRDPKVLRFDALHNGIECAHRTFNSAVVLVLIVVGQAGGLGGVVEVGLGHGDAEAFFDEVGVHIQLAAVAAEARGRPGWRSPA